MQPIGLLMKEHRLIERMIPLIEKTIQKSKETHKIDVKFITISIEFFRNYADKTHHGKEEDILFESLKKIQISMEHKKTMEQLIEDHKTSRAIIAELEDANSQYANGNESVIGIIQEKLRQLTILYPRHIEIEDKQFFFPIMDYFTRKESDDMIQQFFDFDKNMIHEYFHQIIEKQEKLLNI
jgi:hemerythrin-like domain-containing protein